MIPDSEIPQRAHIKARFLAWADRLKVPKQARAIFSRSIDLMLAELAQRDSWAEVKTIRLAGTQDLSLTLSADSWRAFPCAHLLSMTTISPGWSKGWRHILTDDSAYHHLTWFLHYAEQYLHRSQIAKLLMIAWDRDERVLHPFAPAGMSRTYSPHNPAPTMKAMLDAAVIAARKEWGDATTQIPTRSVWSRANTLDPNVHQAIFHFIRGQSLLQHDFELEAVVAFDCAMQALKSLLFAGGLIRNKSPRSDVCDKLGLGASGSIASEANFLRNMIGAHAGGWRWWDTGDVTEELAPAASKLVRRALGKAIRIEPAIRKIDPSPGSWFSWFLTNFDMLWDSVWVDKVQR